MQLIESFLLKRFCSKHIGDCMLAIAYWQLHTGDYLLTTYYYVVHLNAPISSTQSQILFSEKSPSPIHRKRLFLYQVKSLTIHRVDILPGHANCELSIEFPLMFDLLERRQKVSHTYNTQFPPKAVESFLINWVPVCAR